MSTKLRFFAPFGKFSGSKIAALSLLEVLVVLGLCGGIALILSSLFSTQFKSAKLVEDALARQSIRSSIIKSLNCDKTLTANRPPIGSQVTLLNDRNKPIGDELVSGTESTFDGARQIQGDYFYKAFYTGQSGIEVQLVKRTPNSSSWTFDKSLDGTTIYDFTHAAANPLIGGSNKQYPLCTGAQVNALNLLTVSPTMRDIGSVVYGAGESPDYFNPPASKPNSMLKYASCINLTADTNTNSPTGISGSSVVQYPLYLMFSCTKYCRKLGYASGWILGCETFRNPAGTLIFFGQSQAYYNKYNNGIALSNLDEMVPCSCVK